MKAIFRVKVEKNERWTAKRGKNSWWLTSFVLLQCFEFQAWFERKKTKLVRKRGKKIGFRWTERAGALRRGANFFILLPAVSEEAISSPRNSDTPEIKISKICGVTKKRVWEKKNQWRQINAHRNFMNFEPIQAWWWERERGGGGRSSHR